MRLVGHGIIGSEGAQNIRGADGLIDFMGLDFEGLHVPVDHRGGLWEQRVRQLPFRPLAPRTVVRADVVGGWKTGRLRPGALSVGGVAGTEPTRIQLDAIQPIVAAFRRTIPFRLTLMPSSILGV